MAIVRSAGTEIIRSASFEDVDNLQELIIGEQHHIYTVLSVIIKCNALDAVTDIFTMYLTAFDAHSGDSAQNIYIVNHSLQVDETYVWNDKFSFNGCEPTNFTGPMDNATKQNAIADQGNSSVTQKLMFDMTSSDDGGQNYDVHVTYIDQNNV